MSLCNGVHYDSYCRNDNDPYYDLCDAIIMQSAEDYFKAAKYVHRYFKDTLVTEVTYKMINDLYLPEDGEGERVYEKLKHSLGEMKKNESFFHSKDSEYLFYDPDCPGPVAFLELKNSVNNYFLSKKNRGKNDKKS